MDRGVDIRVTRTKRSENSDEERDKKTRYTIVEQYGVSNSRQEGHYMHRALKVEPYSSEYCPG